MKIVCENCSTKYSIADEKVRGKVFKIRCKKCGHIIVVKGTGAAAAASPEPAGQFDDKETRVFDYSGFAESMSNAAAWHVVIDGKQVGPLTPEQVRAKFEGGEIDAETYIWKEGFKDWSRIKDVDEFVDLAASAEDDGATEMVPPEQAAQVFAAAKAAAPAAAPVAAAKPAAAAAKPAVAAAAKPAAASKGMFDEAPAEKADKKGGGDMFGAAAAPAAEESGKGGGMFGAAAAPAGGGLFASPAAASGAGAGKGGSLFPDEPESAAAPKMTGQRNENSVLFSLSNLQSLAAGKPAPAASPKPGYASAKTEGSGLVDIRSIAGSTLNKPSSGGEAGAFSFSAPALSAPISAAPVLMPVVDSGKPKWLIPVIAVGGVLILGVIALLVVLIMSKGKDADKKEPVQTAQKDTMGDGMGDAMTDAMGDAMTDGMGDAMGDAMTDAMADAMGDAMTDDMADAMGDAMTDDMADAMGTRRTGSSGTSGSSGQPRPKTDTMASTSGTSGSSGSSGSSGTSGSSGMSGSSGSSLSDLLMQASMSESSSSGSADPSLPEKLSAGDIRSGVNSVMGQARGCYNRYRVAGTCTIRVVVSGSTGRVSGANVQGEFKGTPTGRCVEQAFAKASFKKFKSSSQSFVFPLIFR
jgi:predicted Zn finger-like uncharacterized protein